MHMGLVTRGTSNTNESHDILVGKWQTVLNLDIFVGMGLAFNGYILSYFEEKIN